MQTILLTSAKYIKSVTNLSDNVSDKFLSPTIQEAQYFDLQSIIGSLMFNKLCSLVQTGDINASGNTAYKNLLNECQIYLAYDVASKVCFKLNYHMDNSGIYTTKDENKESVEMEDLIAIQGHYEKSADNYASHLQRYIIKNILDLPEITEDTLFEIEANLYSAASTGIFLGGKRGKASKLKINTTDLTLIN